MPTNNTTHHLTQRSTLCARLMELALEADDIVDLLLAEDLDPMQTQIYVGGPAFLLSLVLDNLNAAIDLLWLTPLSERPVRLEMAHILASVIPPERRAKYLGETVMTSTAEAATASRSKR